MGVVDVDIVGAKDKVLTFDFHYTVLVDYTCIREQLPKVKDECTPGKLHQVHLVS